MTTTEVPPPMNATKPARFSPFVGARALAGLIDLALVVAAVAPLLIIDLGTGLLIGFAAGAVYATVLEGGPSGQTFGKRMVGVRVVDVGTGGPIGRPRALLRHLIRLPFVGPVFSFRLFVAPVGQTWYDWAAGAVVVPAGPST